MYKKNYICQNYVTSWKKMNKLFYLWLVIDSKTDF